MVFPNVMFLGKPGPTEIACAFFSRSKIIAFINFSKEFMTQKKIIMGNICVYLLFKVNFYLHIQQLFPDSYQSIGQRDMVFCIQGSQK